MNDYMKALHQRFCKEPEGTEEERKMEHAEQALKVTLDWEQRKLLLALVNVQSLWQERTSLESFTAGLRLGLGIAGELEPYSPSTPTRRSGPDGRWKPKEINKSGFGAARSWAGYE